MNALEGRRKFQNLVASKRDWYRLTNLAPTTTGETVAELYIYDFIDWLGITADDLVRELAALDVDVLIVRINSPGGDVFDGIAIKNALIAHPAQIKVVVDGLAASIASVIAMAGDTITMMPGAMMMIHNASSMVWGDANDMRSTADLLDQISANIADVYALRSSSKTSADFAELMNAETWFSAQETVAAGLADAVGVVSSSGNAAVPAPDPAELLEELLDPTEDKATSACVCGPKGWRMAARDGQHLDACPARGALKARPVNLPEPAGVNWEVVPFDGCCDICQDVVDASPYPEDDLPDVPVHPNCDCELQVAYGVDNKVDTHAPSVNPPSGMAISAESFRRLLEEEYA